MSRIAHMQVVYCFPFHSFGVGGERDIEGGRGEGSDVQDGNGNGNGKNGSKLLEEL